MGFRAGQAKGPSVSLGGGGLAAVTTADSNSVDFSGDGTALNALTADVVVDPASPLAVTIGAAGLSVANPVVGFATYSDIAEFNAILADTTIHRAFGLAQITLTGVVDLHARSLWISGEPVVLSAAGVVFTNGAIYFDGKLTIAADTTITIECDVYTDLVLNTNAGGAHSLTIHAISTRSFCYNWTSGRASLIATGAAVLKNIVQGDSDAMGTIYHRQTYTENYALILETNALITYPYAAIVSIRSKSVTTDGATLLVEIADSGANKASVTCLAGRSSGQFARAILASGTNLWLECGTSRDLEIDICPIKSPNAANSSPFEFSAISSASVPANIISQCSIAALSLVTKEVTGWDNPANVDVHYSIAADAWGAARTITLRAVAGTATLYWRNAPLLTIDAATGWTSQPHAVTTDVLYYLYYNGTKWSFGDAVLEITPWDFSEAQAAYVWFGATDKWALRECHGIMQYQSHREDHFNIGTYRRRGATDYGAVTFTPNTFPTAASPASVKRPAVAACELWDEDLMTINPALTGDYCQLYLLNAAVSTFVQNQADIVPFASATTRAAFNLLTGAVWSLSALNTNQYGVVFVVEVPVASDSVSQQYRKVFVLGQAAYASAAAAEAVSFNSLNLSTFGTAAVEWLATQRIVIRGSASNDAWLIQSTQQLVGSQASLVSVSNTGMVNPMTAVGQMIYGTTSGVPSALAAGTAGQLLQSNGAAAPTWVAAPSASPILYVSDAATLAAAIALVQTSKTIWLTQPITLGAVSIVWGGSFTYFYGEEFTMSGNGQTFAPSVQNAIAYFYCAFVNALPSNGVIDLQGTGQTGMSWYFKRMSVTSGVYNYIRATNTITYEQLLPVTATAGGSNISTIVKSQWSNTAILSSLLTAGGQVVASSAAGTPAIVAAGTAGQLLQSNGAAAPTWVAAPSGGGASQTMTFYENAAIGALTRIRPLGTDTTYSIAGIPVLNSGTIKRFACISYGASAAGTMVVRINGGADQTICSLVTSVAPAAQAHATTAIAVSAGDYIELRTDTAAFAFGPYCTLEVS